MRAFVITGAVLGSFTAAQAADLSVKSQAQPTAIVSNWTAIYIGGFAGGSWANVTLANAAPVATAKFNESGFVGGMYLGYDYELPNRFVVGARISVPLGAITHTAAVPLGLPGETATSKFQWSAAGNIIVGYDMGRWMPYIGLGAIFAENKIHLSVPAVGNGSDSELHPGVNLLAGVKYAVTKNWAVGAQYNHSEFANETYTFPTVGGMGSGKASQNSMVATLEYRF
jgi:outer membrane immunogenic protein